MRNEFRPVPNCSHIAATCRTSKSVRLLYGVSFLTQAHILFSFVLYINCSMLKPSPTRASFVLASSSDSAINKPCGLNLVNTPWMSVNLLCVSFRLPPFTYVKVNCLRGDILCTIWDSDSRNRLSILCKGPNFGLALAHYQQ